MTNNPQAIWLEPPCCADPDVGVDLECITPIELAKYLMPDCPQCAEHAITDAILRLRGAFITAGFEPPVAIELASHENGYRMRHIIPRSMHLAHVAESRRGDEDDVVVSMCGMELRYPAKHRRKMRGGFDIV